LGFTLPGPLPHLRRYLPGQPPWRQPNLKSISHRCYPILVAFVWELTKETIHLPLGCLQGGVTPKPETRSPKRSVQWDLNWVDGPEENHAAVLGLNPLSQCPMVCRVSSSERGGQWVWEAPARTSSSTRSRPMNCVPPASPTVKTVSYGGNPANNFSYQRTWCAASIRSS